MVAVVQIAGVNFWHLSWLDVSILNGPVFLSSYVSSSGLTDCYSIEFVGSFLDEGFCDVWKRSGVVRYDGFVEYGLTEIVEGTGFVDDGTDR